VAKAQELFKSNLGLDADRSDSATLPGFTKILLEMSDRQVGQESARRQLLLLAREVDPENAKVRSHLTKILSEDLDVDNGHEFEGLLITMIFEDGDVLPQHLLSKLWLDPTQLSQIKPALLLQLAEQLVCANRSQDGARVAVVAAQQHEAASDIKATQQAFIRAYAMDHSNADASNGVAEMCSAALTECSQLEEECQEQRLRNLVLEERLQCMTEKLIHLEQEVKSKGLFGYIDWEMPSFNFHRLRKTKSMQSSKSDLVGSGVEDLWSFTARDHHAAKKARLYSSWQSTS